MAEGPRGPTSGAGRPAGDVRRHLCVTHEPLDPTDLAARVSDARSGAVASFLGTVRSPDRGERIDWIDYEGYEPMIEAEMARIADALLEDLPLLGIASVHRLGRCRPGEASIAIVACSPHREAAFEACREALERCKARLPIWKRERTAGGERWIEGRTVPEATLP